MEIDEAIIEQKRIIKEATGDEVRIIENNSISYHAGIDFPSWQGDNRRELPSIVYRSEHKSISILHELLHMEKFF